MQQGVGCHALFSYIWQAHDRAAGVSAQAGAALQVLMGAVLLLTGVMVATKVYMDRRVAVAARVALPKAAPGGKRRGRCCPRCLPCLEVPKIGALKLLCALGKHMYRARALVRGTSQTSTDGPKCCQHLYCRS